MGWWKRLVGGGVASNAADRLERAQPMGNSLPSLDYMRSFLHVGMTRDELFSACDDVLGKHRLGISLPALPDINVVGIKVAEGDMLLCFFSQDQLALVYVEYRGDVFLGGD